LNEMEEKRRETIKQIRTLDNKVAELNLKNESLINENNKLQAMLNKKTEALNEKSERVKVLELSNSDYENKIRELEFTESELLAKIELIEEEKIILQYNAEGHIPFPLHEWCPISSPLCVLPLFCHHSVLTKQTFQ
jgi:chromosome segregation ATPase